MPESRPSTHAPERREREATLQELWSTLWRNRWLVAGITGAVVVLAGLASVLVSPVYESEAVLRIETEDSRAGLLGALGPLGGLGGLSGLGQQAIDTEMGILRSRRMATEVTDSLGLTVEVLTPETGGRRLLEVARAAPDTINGTFVLRKLRPGEYSLSPSWLTRGIPDVPSRVRAGEPFRIGETDLRLTSDAHDEIRFRLKSFQRTLREVEKALRVDAQTGGSELVEVSYRSSDPRLAAAVVNTLVGRYIEYKERTDRSKSDYSIDVLREQTESYRRQLTAAEERLRSFQQQQRIIAPQEQATQQVRRMAEVQAQRDALGVERRALGNLLATVERRQQSPTGPSPYRQLATYPSFISNGAVQDLLQTLLELENQKAELLGRRTEQNVDVRTLDARIRDLEGQLHRLAGNYLESLETQTASVDAALAGFGRELAAVPSREIEFARRAREAKLLGEIYVAMQTQLAEASVREAAEPADVRVVDLGLVPEEPVFPKPLVNLVLATVLGLMVGVTVVVGREMMSERIRSKADVEGATAGLPVLGTIPPPADPGRNGTGRSRRVRVPWIAGRGHATLGEPLITRRDPDSPTAEGYRALLTNLSLASPAEGHRVIAVTSPLADDGAADVAANIAVTLAQQAIRTVLVDAGGRAGLQHRLFSIPPEPGLDDVLAGRASLDQALHEVGLAPDGTSLWVLPQGSRPRNGGRILRREDLSRLLAGLGERYERVVLHAPPLSASADAAVLGQLADLTLLVARNDVTTRDALQDAAAQLRRAEVPAVGVVLNHSGPGSVAAGAGGAALTA